MSIYACTPELLGAKRPEIDEDVSGVAQESEHLQNRYNGVEGKRSCASLPHRQQEVSQDHANHERPVVSWISFDLLRPSDSPGSRFLRFFRT